MRKKKELTSMFYSLQKQSKHSEERSFGRFGKSIRPKGFESIKPTFQILSLYTKTGVSLITAGYHRMPQDPLILAFSMEFTIL